jgi:hypothetical protein
VRIYAAGVFPNDAAGLTGRLSRSLAVDAMIEQEYPHVLQTFAYPDHLRRLHPYWNSVLHTALMIDSGAFSALMSGRVISIRAYERFVKELPEQLPPSVEECDFVSLDVIGDIAATRRNFDKLRQLGAPVHPVLTSGSPQSEVDHALASATDPILFLGGLGKPGAWEWLKRTYRYLLSLDRLPRTHLLGASSWRFLSTFPAWSSDTTAWIGALRWGTGSTRDKYARRYTLPKGARYHLGTPQAAVIRRNLNHQLDIFRDRAERATALWVERGIRWEAA